MYRSPNRQATVNSMVFRPTLGEFKDLTKYGTHLEKNCRLAEFGFAKIKPPSEWCPIPQESRCIPPKMGIVADYYNNIEIPCPVRQQILGHKKNGFYEIRNHPMSR